MSNASRAAAAGLQPILPGVLYPLPVLMQSVGLGRHGLREARKAGLPVKRLHGRAYILGDSWIEYVKANGKAS